MTKFMKREAAMTRACLSTVVLSVLALLTAPTPGSSQWLKHPTRGMPRNADGTPDLFAPAPRNSIGEPDLSGIWRAEGRFESDFKPSDALPWAQQQAKQYQDNLGSDTWAVMCLPPGPMINFTGLFKIVQTAGALAILYETSNNYRQIFMDGRDLPRDPNPTWQGYSVGRWEGETLVVDTSGLNSKSTIGRPPYPHSEELRVTERYRRRDFGHIDLQMTVSDPKAFSRAWTIRAELLFAPDNELLEFVCNENEKDRQHFVVAQRADGEETHVDVSVLAKYVGTYTVIDPAGRALAVTITLDGEQLLLDGGNGLHSPLVAQSQTLFRMNRGAIVEFIVSERGEATHLRAHVAEGEITGPRTGPAR